MSSLTNYGENKILDWLIRGQSLSPPGAWWAGLLTAAPSDSAAGTECVGDGYARVSVTANLASWAGTQAAASTTLSTGTSGTTSNNSAINFPTPLAGWGDAGWVALYDASSGGNMWLWAPLNEVKSIFTNDVVVIPIAQLSIQIDN